MSTTKTLADKLKAAPSVSDATGLSILMTDSNGNVKSGIPNAMLPTMRGLYLPQNAIVRIRNITSVLISLRGRLGGRSALIYVTGYSPGTNLRIDLSAIKLHYQYSWYVNGNSESVATVYLCISSPHECEDYLSVVSLAGEIPAVEIVSSLPSDAQQVLVS